MRHVYSNDILDSIAKHTMLSGNNVLNICLSNDNYLDFYMLMINMIPNSSTPLSFQYIGINIFINASLDDFSIIIGDCSGLTKYPLPAKSVAMQASVCTCSVNPNSCAVHPIAVNCTCQGKTPYCNYCLSYRSVSPPINVPGLMGLSTGPGTISVSNAANPIYNTVSTGSWRSEECSCGICYSCVLRDKNAVVCECGNKDNPRGQGHSHWCELFVDEFRK